VVDLNDPSNLALYNQVFLFHNDFSRSEVLFSGHSNAEQRTLQSLAHRLGLDYEYSLATRTARICRPSAEISMNPSELNLISNLLDDFPASSFDFDDLDSTHKPDWLSNTFDNIPVPPLEFNPSSPTNNLDSTSPFLLNDPLDNTWAAAEWLNFDGELLDYQDPVMSAEEGIDWQPPVSDSKPLNDLPELPLPQVSSGAMANENNSERSTSPEEPVQVPGDSDTQKSSTGKRQTTPLSSQLAKLRKFTLRRPACERCRMKKTKVFGDALKLISKWFTKVSLVYRRISVSTMHL
jgi:hypothetical protein